MKGVRAMGTPTTIFQDEYKQSAEIDRLRFMPLGQFRFENTWLKVESDLLSSLEYGEIYIASSDKIEEKIKARNTRSVVYLPIEIKRLLKLNPGPETMKQIHAAKAILGGRVIEVNREF